MNNVYYNDRCYNIHLLVILMTFWRYKIVRTTILILNKPSGNWYFTQF